MAEVKKTEVLLSICIPTYNRAAYLKGALDNIVNDPAFSDVVEVVISDNASTDETQQVGEQYALQHLNIHYYRNSANIRDENFILALQRGNGKYVRLFNDTLRFQEGALQKMLDVIDSSSTKEPLFFYQKIDFIPVNGGGSIAVKGSSDFLSCTSFWVTWIANFGNWKKMVDDIPFPTECASLLLTQVDWSFKIMELYGSAKICYDNYFISILPKKKGGYNIFEVFVGNYLQILRKHEIRNKALRKEKYRLYRYFLLQWIYNLYVHKEDFSFEKRRMWEILFKEYRFCLYFYLGIGGIMLKSFFDSFSNKRKKNLI